MPFKYECVTIPNSSSESLWPSTSASINLVTMSSPPKSSPPLAQGEGSCSLLRAVVQPGGALLVPDAERVRLDTVDRADIGQQHLVCCRAQLVADDTCAGVVGLEIERRRAAVAADVDDHRRARR